MPTMGQLLINEALPPELRDYDRVWSKENVKDVMAEVQSKYPDQYKDISKRLYDVGRASVTMNGNQASVSLNDFKQSPELQQKMNKIKAKVEAVVDDDRLTQEQKNEQLVDYISGIIPTLTEDVIEDSLKRKTALGSQVSSGARGNKSQLAQSIVGDLMVADSKAKPIPVPILHGYGEGVDPAEYWAASYGSRKGYIDIQEGTAKAGFFSKQMVGAAHRLRVTEEDCGTSDGIPVDSSDSDSVGSVLAIPVGDYSAGTILDNDSLRSIKRSHKKLLVRSPVTCKASGGVCRKCAGVREKGRLADIGDNIGISSVQALCLAEDTLVRMADGSSKRIRDIIIGDMVVGCSVAGVAKPVQVLNVYNNGPKLCYETKFRQGTGSTTTLPSVVSTLDHKILSVHISRRQQEDKDRHPAAEIRPIKVPDSTSTSYYAKMSLSYDDTNHQEEPMALALGLVIGDGSFTGGCGGGITFSCYDPSLEEEFNTYLQQFELKLMKMTDGEFRITQNSKDVRLSAKDGQEVRNVLKYNLIQCDLWGKRSVDKTLPTDWRKWDNSSLANLAAGLIASDGCIHLPKKGNGIYISFASKSLVLISELKELLSSRFGIFCSNPCPSIKKRPEGGYYDPVFHISIAAYDNVVRFADAIKIPGVKGPKLAKALQDQTKGIRTMEAGRLSFVEQEEVGVLNTYDIEVDHPDHLFILDNGLVVSNSEPITQSQLCLAVGTLVRMGDRSIQQIESIKAGDMVLASDVEGKTFPTRVEAVHINGLKECTAVMFTKPDGDKCVIRCTKDHKVLKVNPGKGTSILEPIGSPTAHTIMVGALGARYSFSHTGSTSEVQTYDIEIDTPDHLFVLGNGLIVSNSSKHTGGVVGQTAGAVSGFDAINQLVQVPKTFRDAAAIATLDGRVSDIIKAPQGGSYIVINDQNHYIAEGQTPSVKVGQVMEAGDIMSDGLPNPAQLVEHKGIGEGRRLFVNAFQDTLKKSGVSANRRNVDLLARGTINHVEITDVDGPNGSVMGDVIEYDSLAKNYKPRKGTATLGADKSYGRYLEKPVLNYSIGTRITPNVAKNLKEFSINEIETHDKPPPFKPKMIRIMDNLSKADDWQVRMGGFHLGKGLSSAAQRGSESKVTGNQSYIPALAYGKTFGTGDKGEGF